MVEYPYQQGAYCRPAFVDNEVAVRTKRDYPHGSSGSRRTDEMRPCFCRGITHRRIVDHRDERRIRGGNSLDRAPEGVPACMPYREPLEAIQYSGRHPGRVWRARNERLAPRLRGDQNEGGNGDQYRRQKVSPHKVITGWGKPQRAYHGDRTAPGSPETPLFECSRGEGATDERFTLLSILHRVLGCGLVPAADRY